MNQNKILSLEEIEKIEVTLDNTPEQFHAYIKDFRSAINTARAYHEAVKGERQYSCCCKGFYPSSNGGCFNCGHDEDSHSGLIECCNKVDVEYREKHLASEDKPHPATIKVIIEALEAGTEFEGDIDDDRPVFNPIKTKKHLESILKEL